ncbi:MAG: 5-amino-6-(D-ribitylamino)uracil--L-tyrosine 4-hydroxyphenyl transferase CofH, partial [Gammaproteobacteria bacterium]|nr:5-amino-6-(D-ribitylamino)uracil--L-tyrosine 4-hydroxyphenyl transferase CofH [Gammaproteobacteria bacterium]
TLEGFGANVSYSPKVFIPLTRLCRDVCGYCTFATAPQPGRRAYLTEEEVLAIAERGASTGCHEALFTLGDKPELRYRQVREELAALGCATTLEYLGRMAQRVFEHTGLLPHLNPGVMSAVDIAALRPRAASMGLMLESTSRRLLERGGPHWRAPDKEPALRLATLAAGGAERIAMTTGILIGIGETRRERIESLLAIRELHERFGHIQEVIVQNFRAKPRTRMARAADADLAELCWSIAVARLVLGPTMSIQAPPNLSPGSLQTLLAAGINDWGGVSPVTADHVNPEAPWPTIEQLAEQTAAAGRTLCARLPLVPAFALQAERWCAPAIATAVRQRSDSRGYALAEAWRAGGSLPPPMVRPAARPLRRIAGSRTIAALTARAARGRELSEREIVTLFMARGAAAERVLRAADELRAAVAGDVVTYVVNRNINYTNICRYRCGFCAFAKGRSAAELRGPAYDLSLEEIRLRTVEAAERGATEVCLQGGIHPRFTGSTYLEIARAVKTAAPQIHLHAFSPLEVAHGAATLGVSVEEFLGELRAAGLATLPGTAAEILDDEVRAVICPDKLTTDEWLAVMRAAHERGLRSTATIMFGHVETPLHWARHLLRIRRLQQETGGFTEFVPLPFVHMQAPLWRKGRARPGPSFEEALLMHAVARLVLHPLIPNVQASWVKLGLDGAAQALHCGANDLGGTLMNESITRAAGGSHGQQQDARTLRAAIRAAGRQPRQRDTLYRPVVAVAAEGVQSTERTDRAAFGFV